MRHGGAGQQHQGRRRSRCRRDPDAYPGPVRARNRGPARAPGQARRHGNEGYSPARAGRDPGIGATDAGRPDRPPDFGGAERPRVCAAPYAGPGFPGLHAGHAEPRELCQFREAQDFDVGCRFGDRRAAGCTHTARAAGTESAPAIEPGRTRAFSGRPGLTEIILREGDHIEWAIKAFRRKVQRSNILRDLRKKRHYVKPSIAKRLKQQAAAARRRKAKKRPE
ncbi:MAG: 30S ribosomal protein S21 [Gemmatimonadetes bacterium]|nr:30S ribosomal protein S21 [Gemmatimonadota bacterium]